jgi:hypothetical protein
VPYAFSKFPAPFVMKAIVTRTACIVLLWAGTVLATQTPQQKCDHARVMAWKTYLSCVDTVVAKDAGCVPNASCPPSFSEFAAFATCRHAYFKKWTAFQSSASLTGSTCVGGRFTTTDGGTTVTDALTGLIWEKKTNDSTVHDVGNVNTWSTGTSKGDGTAFTTFLAGALTGLNVAGFGGAEGWRLPTLAELQTIVLDFTCTKVSCLCGSDPCIDATFGPTQSSYYWSATSWAPNSADAWYVLFDTGSVGVLGELGGDYVRAVRGGL